MTPFRFDETFRFPVSVDEFWATVSRTDRYTEWWGWLREFDGPGLQEGAVAHCLIQAPLPYALRLTVTVAHMVPCARVETRIDGDLAGPARLELEREGDSCAARLVWSLELRPPVLRRLAAVGRPAMSWAHDRVIARGVRQFEERALRPRVAG
jgi:hypothetical protein